MPNIECINFKDRSIYDQVREKLPYGAPPQSNPAAVQRVDISIRVRVRIRVTIRVRGAEQLMPGSCLMRWPSCIQAGQFSCRMLFLIFARVAMDTQIRRAAVSIESSLLVDSP